MFPFFPYKEAFFECKKAIDKIFSKEIRIVNLTTPSTERKNCGIMLGVLICSDSNNKRYNLLTISGVSKTLAFNSSFLPYILVPPIVTIDKINATLKKNDALIHSLTNKINKTQDAKLKSMRKVLTDESLIKVYELYEFNCFDNRKRKLLEICKGSLPPTGTGDCCTIKLIDYMLKNNLSPISMAEVYIDKTNIGIKYRLASPCNSRCSLITPAMLGIKIIYRDDDIIAINKESGILSVPGRSIDKKDCVVNRVKRLFPTCIEQPAVHRLDMETSGIMILALTQNAHDNLSRQFENKEVYKEYIALVDGVIKQKSGIITLYHIVDIENRPHQTENITYGKMAITEYRVLDIEEYKFSNKDKRVVSRVLFIPYTGRTHQIRVASYSKKGLGYAIIGDSLYGVKDTRLMLHARKISFIHPKTNKRLTLKTPSPF